jgi:1,4-alpha-glucan branching enzyme
VVRHDYRLGAPGDISSWQEVLNTDAAVYGGGDVVNADPVKAEPAPYDGRPATLRLTLPPLATIWLKPV